MREQRRFFNPKPTKYGRIGHPAALDRKLVRCAGVTFIDKKEGKKWTFRMYEKYRDQWPELAVWTVQILMPTNTRAHTPDGYGPQTKVEEEDVPGEVREFALACLVRFRLNGQVYA